ncbi:hypothetical protein GQ457_04G007120 [Hibiscus cannabinus]
MLLLSFHLNHKESIKALQETSKRHEQVLISLQVHFDEQKQVNDCIQRTLQNIVGQLEVISSKLGLPSKVSTDSITKSHHLFDELSKPTYNESVHQSIQDTKGLESQSNGTTMQGGSKEIDRSLFKADKPMLHEAQSGVQGFTNQTPYQRLSMVEPQKEREIGEIVEVVAGDRITHVLKSDIQSAMKNWRRQQDTMRVIGCSLSIQSDNKLWPFKVVSRLDDKLVIMVNYKSDGRQFDREEIFSIVSIKMHETIESYLSSIAKRDMVIFPAYFNDSQVRQVTKDAGINVGPNVITILTSRNVIIPPKEAIISLQSILSNQSPPPPTAPKIAPKVSGKKSLTFLKYRLVTTVARTTGYAGYLSYKCSCEEVDHKAKALRVAVSYIPSEDASAIDKYGSLLYSAAMGVPTKALESYLDLKRLVEEQLWEYTEPTSDRKRERGWRTFKRPGVDAFLEHRAKFYEIVVYSNHMNMHVDPPCERLDGNHYILYRLSRSDTKYQDGKHYRDLSKLNRDPTKILYVSAHAFDSSLHLDNCVPIKLCKLETDDTTLLDLIPFLEYIACNSSVDIRQVLQSYERKDVAKEFLERFKEHQRRKQEQVFSTYSDNQLGVLIQVYSMESGLHPTRFATLKYHFAELQDFIAKVELEPNFWFMPLHRGWYNKLLRSIYKVTNELIEYERLIVVRANQINFISLIV